MSFPAFAWGVRFFSLVTALGLISLVLGVNPEEKPWARVLFFVSFFLTMSGGAAWGLLTFYRRYVSEAEAWHYRRLLEQASLFGGLCTSLLLLEYFRAFVWWTVGLVLVFFFLIELSCRQGLKGKQHIT
ncbi:MAG: hypothetical protein KA054_00300 [Candidatus Moranbacteria bacterium]|nr:hypothetical protein [Candidatus Moranbacteria bacterium]